MNDVYEKTYRHYLSQFNTINHKAVEENLGVFLENNGIVVPLLKEKYKVGADGITGPEGKRPALYICIILFKYLYMCPDIVPAQRQWASYKDLKDSGPLNVYFANDIERPIAKRFAGKKADLENAAQKLGGCPAGIESGFDLALRFDALPRLPVLLLFNDADDEFPSACSLLFEACAEQYLDPECLAMVAGHLAAKLEQ